MDLGIKGRTALVTASSKGLGRGTALAFAAEGANLVITARGADTLQKTADELREFGGQVVVVPADVTSPEPMFWRSKMRRRMVRSSTSGAAGP